IEGDVENLKGWLKRFESFIPANPKGKQKGLFKSFPGFNLSQGFCAQFIYGSNFERILSPNDIKKILGEKNHEQQIINAVDLFNVHIKFLSVFKNCDVVICVIPN
ncbi:hypothetical protein ACLUYJ_20015, partial [Acinetobacter baumannii]|uniref:hypothetical protein n=1 Tax=Acinetobacter baumannii TaxID=470 RepID=UPI0039916519